MFCSKCGTQNADGVAFCKTCGSPLSAPAAPSAANAYAPAPAFAPDAPAVAALKKVAASPLMLVAAISLSVSLLFGLIWSLVGGLTDFVFNSQLSRLVDDYRLYRSALQSTSVISAISASIPSILTVIGFWLIYAGGRKAGPMKTAGFTMIKVILIIGLVCVCIGAGVSLIALIVALVGASAASIFGNANFGYAEAAASIGIVLGVILLAVVFIFAILFLVKAIKSINTAKRTAVTGVASDAVSPFVAVMCFIGVAGTAITALVSLFTLQILTFFTLAASATFMICCGCLIFRYRSAQRALLPQTRAVYAAPAYAPVQQPAPAQPAPAPVQQPAPAQPAPAPAPAEQPAPAQTAPSEPAQPMIVCSNCGTSFSPEYAFCPNCGTAKQ